MVISMDQPGLQTPKATGHVLNGIPGR